MRKNVEKNKKNKNTIRILAVIISLLIYIIINCISLRGQYLSIKGIGDNYLDIFRTNIKYKYMVTFINFIVIYLIVYITNKLIKKGLKKFFDDEKRTMPKLPNKTFAVIIGLIVSIIGGNLLTEKFMLFSNTAFFGGENDPIFGLDIGYYIFSEPFIETILVYAITIFAVLTLYVAVYYIISLNIYFDGVDMELLKKNTFIKQIILNVVIITLLASGLVFLKSQNILIQNMISINDESNTSLVGAGMTDVTIKLWGYRILSIIIIISVARAIMNVKKMQFKKMFLSLIIIPVYLVGLFIVMTLFQLIYVEPNQLDKEKAYIDYNIDYTRKAYGLEINEIDIDNYDTITYDQISSNAEILQNIPIIDKDVVYNTLSNYQDNTGYYSYRNTQIANYNINGNNKLVYLTPREIVSDSNRTASNKIYRYTHGYGVVVNSASSVDKNGYVEYVQSSFDSSNDKINITEPRIYFGLENNNPIIVNTNYGAEYDYPSSTSTYEENRYNGNAGLKLNALDRLVVGINNQDMSLVFSKYLNGDSKIITDRNIIQRAKSLLPYLKYDDNPYLIITDEGKLLWVIDAYTLSDKYPYSQLTVIENQGNKQKINYIRNSAKVFIDAYDGTTTFYITDKDDPIIMAYKNIYPSLFTELDESYINSLSQHFIYPKFLYDIQSRMLEMYHKTNVEVLYRADDIWSIATQNLNSTSASKVSEINSYYTMVKTLDSKSDTLGLVVPYTKSGKQNLNAYLVGTYEGANPKLTLYKFNSDTNVAGVLQLSSQIEQDETISAEINSISVSGTKLIKNIIIVPINNTLLYIEPVYQVRLNESPQIPILKKVIVASGNKVTVGNTLEEALMNLLSEYAVNLEIINTEDIDEIIDSIIRANKNLKESEDSKDWTLIGKDLKKLQELLDNLEKARKKELKDESSNGTSFINSINIGL